MSRSKLKARSPAVQECLCEPVAGTTRSAGARDRMDHWSVDRRDTLMSAQARAKDLKFQSTMAQRNTRCRSPMARQGTAAAARNTVVRERYRKPYKAHSRRSTSIGMRPLLTQFGAVIASGQGMRLKAALDPPRLPISAGRHVPAYSLAEDVCPRCQSQIRSIHAHRWPGPFMLAPESARLGLKNGRAPL